jgi:hypothetical protein
MDLDVFSARQLPIVCRALRGVFGTSEPLSHDALTFLAAAARVLGHDGDVHALAPVPPRTVAGMVVTPHARKRLVQLASVAALVARPVRADAVAYVHELARALATHDPILPVLAALAKGRVLRARLLTMRRMVRVIFKEAYASEGVAGVLRVFGALWLKLTVNKARRWSYKRLGLLPEGTLGREYWKHLTELGFAFPGELGGIPQVVAYHDVGHVLTGYDTTPRGEIQQGAFQAGCRREDGFVFLQFVLLQFHQGIKLTPVAAPETGLFDPNRVLGAVQRGSRCPVDITHGWDFWPLMQQPITAVRAALALTPAG